MWIIWDDRHVISGGQADPKSYCTVFTGLAVILITKKKYFSK
jgi:hypothetical protein